MVLCSVLADTQPPEDNVTRAADLVCMSVPTVVSQAYVSTCLAFDVSKTTLVPLPQLPHLLPVAAGPEVSEHLRQT
jgi:hypothetical protein